MKIMADLSTAVSEKMQHSPSRDILKYTELTDGLSIAEDTTLIETIPTIIICSVGLASNLCAFVLILKTSLIKNTIGVYLTIITVLDNLCLIFHSFNLRPHIWLRNDFSCNMMWTFTTLFPRLSWHVLLCMTIDRCYNMLTPYKPNTKRRSAFLISTVVVCLSTLLYLTLLWNTFGIATVSNDTYNTPISRNASLFKVAAPKAIPNRIICTPLPQHKMYLKNVFLPGDLIIWGMLVPIVVTMCNLIIIIFLKKNSAVAPASTSTALSNRDKKVARLLVVVSLCYVLFVVPKGIYFSLIPKLYDNISEAISGRNPAFQVVNNLFLLNHCTNLYLYLLSSKSFREESKLVFTSLWNMLILHRG